MTGNLMRSVVLVCEWEHRDRDRPGRVVTPLVRYERDGHVATITYDRPQKLNAINGALRADLNAAWEQFRGDDEAWVGIVTGAGKAFCVGADLHDGAGAAGTWPGSFWELPTVNSFESGLEVWKPTIAAVNGYCLGYGLTAVSACDFVIAADDAEFGMPEVRLGVPTIVGAMRLPGRIGMQHALELLLTGDRVDARRAREIGLAWKVVPRAELMPEARALADRLCQGAPLAVRAVNEVAHRVAHLPWEDAVRMGEAMRRLVAATDDAREGFAAAAEDRPPRWTGR
jgi:E-phenylitaconyl-CoA hydratase